MYSRHDRGSDASWTCRALLERVADEWQHPSDVQHSSPRCQGHDEGVLETQGLPEEEAAPFRHAAATFVAFVVAGAMPLIPYMIPVLTIDRFMASIALTFLAMFGVGASRALIADVRWWKAGFEMLGLGAVVAALYGSGAVVARMVEGV